MVSDTLFRVIEFPLGSLMLRITVSELPLVTPVVVTVWVCVWLGDVPSLPPVIAGLIGVPPGTDAVGHAALPRTFVVPFQETHPDSVLFCWTVKMTFEVPIPPPLPDNNPKKTNDACAELLIITPDTMVRGSTPRVR